MSAYYGMRNALWFARRFHRKSIQALTTMFLCVYCSGSPQRIVSNGDDQVMRRLLSGDCATGGCCSRRLMKPCLESHSQILIGVSVSGRVSAGNYRVVYDLP